MKITVVGSSHGIPEANRGCACLLIEAGTNHYFLDMGSSGMNALRKRGIAPDNVRGIFITHMHGDHINGLVEFVDLCTWYYKTAKPTIVCPMPEIEGILTQWYTLVPGNRVPMPEFRKTQPGVVFDDGTLKVTAIATQHCLLSHAYLLEAEGERVLCTGDLKTPTADFPAVEGALDLLVCESAHFPATEYAKVLHDGQVKEILLTHYSDTYLESCLQLKRAMAEKGLPVTLASDDLEIHI